MFAGIHTFTELTAKELPLIFDEGCDNCFSGNRACIGGPWHLMLLGILLPQP